MDLNFLSEPKEPPVKKKKKKNLRSGKKKPTSKSFKMKGSKVDKKIIQAREQWADVTFVEFPQPFELKFKIKAPQEILIDVSLKPFQIPTEIISIIFSYLRYNLSDLDKILMNSKDEEEILDILCLLRKQIEKGQRETVHVVNLPHFPSLISFYLTTLTKKETIVFHEAIQLCILILKHGTQQLFSSFFDDKFWRDVSDLLEKSHVSVIKATLEFLDHALSFGAGNRGQYNENPYATKVEQAGILDRLEALQRHENEEIYTKTVQLLSKHFSGEEEYVQQDAVPPPVPTNNTKWNSAFQF